MGLEISCCGENRAKSKLNPEESKNNRDEDLNAELSILSVEMTEERKDWSMIFVDFRSVPFKNMQAKLSCYEDLVNDFTFANLQIKNERYDLYYKNVLSTFLQQKFTHQVFQVKSQNSQIIDKQINYLQRLDHPFIASSVEYFQDENEFIIVMDQLPSYSLQDIINQQKKFEEVQIRRLGYSLLLLARYLHKNKTILFSFTPENIFIQNPRNFKIIKLTKFTESIIYEHAPLSKFIERQFDEDYYFSNELYDYSKKVNSSADIFAIGVILLQMALGDHPKNMIKGWEQNTQNTKNNNHELLFKLLWQNKKYMSEALYDVFQMCFQTDTQKRNKPDQMLQLGFFQVKQSLKRQNREFFYKLTAYSKLNIWQRIIFQFIVLKLFKSQSKIKYEQSFLRLDKQGKGFITESDLYQILLNIKQDNQVYYDTYSTGKEPSALSQQLFSVIDTTGDGEFNFSEYLVTHMFWKISPQEIDLTIDFLFAWMDINQQDLVVFQNISKIPQFRKDQQKALLKLLKELDQNNKQQLTRQQFVDGIKSKLEINFKILSESIQSQNFDYKIFDTLYYS